MDNGQSHLIMRKKLPEDLDYKQLQAATRIRDLDIRLPNVKNQPPPPWLPSVSFPKSMRMKKRERIFLKTKTKMGRKRDDFAP